MAEEPSTKRLFLYKEYQGGNKTVKEHIDDLMDGETIMPWCCGGAPSEDQWRREFRKAGLAIAQPDTGEVEVQISRVWSTIKAGGLIVLDCCPMAIEYFTKYSRVPDAAGQPTKEIQNKSSYHVGDSIRYIVSRLRR